MRSGASLYSFCVFCRWLYIFALEGYILVYNFRSSNFVKVWPQRSFGMSLVIKDAANPGGYRASIRLYVIVAYDTINYCEGEKTYLMIDGPFCQQKVHLGLQQHVFVPVSFVSREIVSKSGDYCLLKPFCFALWLRMAHFRFQICSFQCNKYCWEELIHKYETTIRNNLCWYAIFIDAKKEKIVCIGDWQLHWQSDSPFCSNIDIWPLRHTTDR